MFFWDNLKSLNMIIPSCIRFPTCNIIFFLWMRTSHSAPRPHLFYIFLSCWMLGMVPYLAVVSNATINCDVKHLCVCWLGGASIKFPGMIQLAQVELLLGFQNPPCGSPQWPDTFASPPAAWEGIIRPYPYRVFSDLPLWPGWDRISMFDLHFSNASEAEHFSHIFPGHLYVISYEQSVYFTSIHIAWVAWVLV